VNCHGRKGENQRSRGKGPRAGRRISLGFGKEEGVTLVVNRRKGAHCDTRKTGGGGEGVTAVQQRTQKLDSKAGLTPLDQKTGKKKKDASDTGEGTWARPVWEIWLESWSQQQIRLKRSVQPKKGRSKRSIKKGRGKGEEKKQRGQKEG